MSNKIFYAIGSGFANLAISVILYPMELTITKKQLGTVKQKTLHYICGTWRTVGFAGLYKGFGLGLLSRPTFWAVYTYSNVFFTEKNMPNMLKSFLSLSLGILAANPLFVWQTRKQNNNYKKENTLFQKIASYGKGFGITLLKSSDVYISICLSNYLNEQYGANKVISSVITKFSIACLLYPLVVVRTHNRNTIGTISNTKIVRQIYNRFGLCGFYFGFVTYSINSLAKFACVMLINDQATKK